MSTLKKLGKKLSVNNVKKEATNLKKNVSINNAKKVVNNNKGAILGTMVGGPVGGIIGNQIDNKLNKEAEQKAGDAQRAQQAAAEQKVIQDKIAQDQQAAFGAATYNKLRDNANVYADKIQNAASNYGSQIINEANRGFVPSANAGLLDAQGGQMSQTLAATRALRAQLEAGPQADSFAQRQLTTQGNRALAQNQGMLAAGGGALAQRNAMRNAGQIQSDLLLNRSNLGLQEQELNRNQLMSTLGMEGGMANNLTNLGYNVATGEAAMRGNALNTNAQLGMGGIQAGYGMQNDAITQQIEGAQQLEALRSGERAGLNSLLENQRQFNKQAKMQRDQNMIQNIGTGVATAGAIATMFSDRNLKTDIKDGKKEVKELLKHVKSESYSYKNKEHGEGTYVSPMAQDLEKSKIGKSMVINTPEGKMVNYGRVVGTLLSHVADLDKKIEKNLKSTKKKG